jgi:hypothetical protein
MVLGEPGTPEFDEFVKSERADWKAGTMHPGVKQMWMHYLVGKPTERVEHSGIDGEPLEVITRIVRVTVTPGELAAESRPTTVTH